MGPILLIRERSANTQDMRERLIEHTRDIARVGHMALLAVVPALLALANSQTRHWLAEAITTLCVVGGFLAAPVLTLIAWVGMILPERVPLHRASTALFVVSLVWVTVAVIAAHAHTGSRREDAR